MTSIAWPYRMVETIRERYGYRTDVLTSINRNEQRIQQRMQPVGGVESTAQLRDADVVSAQRLLERNQAGEWAAPLWQYAIRLAEPLAGAGETTVSVDPADELPYLPFVDAAGVGRPFYIWRDPDYWFLTSCDRQATDITATDPITKAFPAGAMVVPARLGRLENVISTSRPSRSVAGQPLSFRFDGVDPQGGGHEPEAVLSSPATYAGFDVLEKNNGRDGSFGDTLDRAFDTLDGQLGALATDDHVIAPSRLMDFRWICRDRVDGALLREFVDLRRGRAVPVWVPSSSQDLQLVGTYSSGASTLTLVDGDAYRTVLFPNTGARRHLQFQTPNGTRRWRKVASCSGATITLDSALDIDLPAGTLVSFIRLSRLEDDEVEILWYPTRAAESRFQFRELPQEAPL